MNHVNVGEINHVLCGTGYALRLFAKGNVIQHVRNYTITSAALPRAPSTLASTHVLGLLKIINRRKKNGRDTICHCVGSRPNGPPNSCGPIDRRRPGTPELFQNEGAASRATGTVTDAAGPARGERMEAGTGPGRAKLDRSATRRCWRDC